MRSILLIILVVHQGMSVDVAEPVTGGVQRLAASAQPGQAPLVLRGQGRLTYYFWKIYDVELYLPVLVPSAAVLNDHPRRLQFTYLRAFTAEDLSKATTTTIHERQGSVPEPEVAAGLAAINALWPSVAVGDRLELLYEPGQGTTVSLNGKRLGQVSGVQFARVLFSIWLGERSINDGLRWKLLGK